jgi:hypothetical protein
VEPWEPLSQKDADTTHAPRGNPQFSVPISGTAVAGYQVGYGAFPGVIDSIARAATNPTPSSAASLENGRKYYQINCAVCHGDQGRGDGPAGSRLTPRTVLPIFMRVWILATALLTTTFGSASAGGQHAGELRGVVMAGDKPVIDAVVWLDSPDAPPLTPSTAPLLDQRNLDFWPHVLVVRVGTTVRFPNNDRVFHNVFSFRDGKRFDLGVYPIGAVKHVTFDRAGVSRLFCNIHPNMAAYVVAVDSPYFAASDASGAFTLRAPPGRYTYHAWRAGAPERTGVVTLDRTGSVTIEWP